MAKEIIILYTDAGGGHKAAAQALQQILNKRTNWQVTLLNPFAALFDNFDLIKKFTGISSEDTYNKYVSSKGNSLLSLLLMSLIFKFNLFLFKKKITKKMTRIWVDMKLDMVISVAPFINEIVNDSLLPLNQKVPFVSLITDYSECANNLWITSKQQYLICGTTKLVEQARNRHHPASKIFATSGMIVRPTFYERSKISNSVTLLQLGLVQGLPTGIVIFGTYGSAYMLEILEGLNGSKPIVQMIFICGKNIELKQKLDEAYTDYPKLVLGFIDNVQDYMAIADFIIGKPGGSCISEAVIMKLPMIIHSNFFSLLQEKYNAQWVVENGLGIIVHNFASIDNNINYILSNIDIYKQRYININNMGVFEVPGILEKIFTQNS